MSSEAVEAQRALLRGEAKATLRAATHTVRDDYALSPVRDGAFGLDIRIPSLPGDAFIGRFSERALEDASAILALSQTNPVMSSEELAYRPTPEGARRYDFDDTTPPYLLARWIADQVEARQTLEVGFGDERFGGAPMFLDHVAQGSRSLSLRGRAVDIEVARFVSGPGEPPGAIEVACGSQLLLRIEREGWVTELCAID